MPSAYTRQKIMDNLGPQPSQAVLREDEINGFVELANTGTNRRALTGVDYQNLPTLAFGSVDLLTGNETTYQFDLTSLVGSFAPLTADISAEYLATVVEQANQITGFTTDTVVGTLVKDTNGLSVGVITDIAITGITIQTISVKDHPAKIPNIATINLELPAIQTEGTYNTMDLVFVKGSNIPVLGHYVVGNKGRLGLITEIIGTGGTQQVKIFSIVEKIQNLLLTYSDQFTTGANTDVGSTFTITNATKVEKDQFILNHDTTTNKYTFQYCTNSTYDSVSGEYTKTYRVLSLSGWIKEAPIDNKRYIRENGLWVELPLVGEMIPMDYVDYQAATDITAFEDGDIYLIYGAPGPVYPVTSVNTMQGDVIINKNSIGLGQVDNTSDLNKPVSYATQYLVNQMQTAFYLAISTEENTRIQQDAWLLSLIQGLQMGGKFIESVDNETLLPTVADPSWTINDYFTVQQDSTHGGMPSKWIISSLSPFTIVYDFTYGMPSGFMNRVPSATVNSLAIFDTTTAGQVRGSTILESDLIVKKPSAIIDNVAIFSANGDIADSGLPIQNVETATHASATYQLLQPTANQGDIALFDNAGQVVPGSIGGIGALTNKMDKVPLAGENNIAIYDNAGQVKDSGTAISNIVTTTNITTVINNDPNLNFMPKVPTAVAGNMAMFDSNGCVVDSGGTGGGGAVASIEVNGVASTDNNGVATVEIKGSDIKLSAANTNTIAAILNFPITETEADNSWYN